MRGDQHGGCRRCRPRGVPLDRSTDWYVRPHRVVSGRHRPRTGPARPGADAGPDPPSPWRVGGVLVPGRAESAGCRVRCRSRCMDVWIAGRERQHTDPPPRAPCTARVALESRGRPTSGGADVTARRLWTALAILLPALAATIAPMSAVDLAYQVRAGELMLESGTVLRADPFTFTAMGEPWLNQQWGAGVIFALVQGLLGWGGLVVLRVALVARSRRSRRGGGRSVAAVAHRGAARARWLRRRDRFAGAAGAALRDCPLRRRPGHPRVAGPAPGPRLADPRPRRWPGRTSTGASSWARWRSPSPSPTTGSPGGRAFDAC